MDANTKVLLEEMRREGVIEPWECCVVGEGIFFREERPAAMFAERHGKKLVRIEQGQLIGWLAQNPL